MQYVLHILHTCTLYSILIVIGIHDEDHSSISVGTVCATYTVYLYTYSIIIVIGIPDEDHSSIFVICSRVQ